MTGWKRICCAVDFAEPSRVALEQGAELARELATELELVNVRVPAPPAASNVLVSSRGVGELEAEEHERTLEEWRAEAERRAGRAVRARTLVGEPAGELVRHAREEGHDLLVVGTHGRRGLPRLILGSVAERVARQAECSVLVARPRRLPSSAAEREELEQYR